MPDYSKPLGDVVKCARKRLDLTQNEVADSINVDGRKNQTGSRFIFLGIVCVGRD